MRCGPIDATDSSVFIRSPDMSVSPLIDAENQAYLPSTSSVKQKICIDQMIRPSVVGGLSLNEMYL